MDEDEDDAREGEREASTSGRGDEDEWWDADAEAERPLPEIVSVGSRIAVVTRPAASRVPLHRLQLRRRLRAVGWRQHGEELLEEG